MLYTSLVELDCYMGLPPTVTEYRKQEAGCPFRRQRLLSLEAYFRGRQVLFRVSETGCGSSVFLVSLKERRSGQIGV